MTAGEWWGKILYQKLAINILIPAEAAAAEKERERESI
jgi:hypothetical protein